MARMSGPILSGFFSSQKHPRGRGGKFASKGGGAAPQHKVPGKEAGRQKTLVAKGGKDSWRELHDHPIHGQYYVEKGGKRRPVYKDPNGIGRHRAQKYTFQQETTMSKPIEERMRVGAPALGPEPGAGGARTPKLVPQCRTASSTTDAMSSRPRSKVEKAG